MIEYQTPVAFREHREVKTPFLQSGWFVGETNLSEYKLLACSMFEAPTRYDAVKLGNPIGATLEAIRLEVIERGVDIAPEIASRATAWISDMYYDLSSFEMTWVDPYVNSNSNGDLVFEWITDHRSASVYVTQDEIYAIISLGRNPQDGVKDIDLNSSPQRLEFWSLIYPA